MLRRMTRTDTAYLDINLSSKSYGARHKLPQKYITFRHNGF